MPHFEGMHWQKFHLQLPVFPANKKIKPIVIMVNLKIAMRMFLLVLPFIFLPLFWQVQEPAATGVYIDAPKPGEAIQGVVAITGVTDIADFARADLYFGYPDDDTGTWFPIAEDIPQHTIDTLAEWNTFLITDGTYNLLLVVETSQGTKEEMVVRGIRIRNYTLIETNTPTPIITPSPTETLDPTQLSELIGTPTPSPTPAPTGTITPLPPNPARLTTASLQGGLLVGVGGAVLLFVLLGLYISIRNAFRK